MGNKGKTFFAIALASAFALVLAGCVSVTQGVDGNLSVQNLSIIVQAPNVSLPVLAGNLSITIASAPDNLTVCVVGLKTQASEELFSGNFTYASRNFSYHPEFYDGYATLGECNLLVFKGDEMGEFVGREQRIYAAKAVSDGVSLMFSKKAFFKVKEDTTVDGWAFLVEGLIPVQTGAAGHELVEPREKTVSRRFEFRNYYDIWEGFKNFDVENLNITETLQSDDALVVADFSSPPTAASDVAITAKQSTALSGRVLYFAFDAFDSQDAKFQGISKQAVLFLLQDFLGKRFIV